MPEFKVGQRIRTRWSRDASDDDDDWRYEEGEVYEVVCVGGENYMIKLVKALPGEGREGTKLSETHEFIDESFILFDTPSMDIVEIIRNTFTWVFGSKEQRLLRKTGLKDDRSQWTDEARQIYLESLMEQDVKTKDKSVLLEAAKTIKEEKEEEKKCC